MATLTDQRREGRKAARLMRALILALALVSMPAFAAPADEVSAEDWTALELAQARVDTAAAQLDAVRAKVALKYRIEDGDSVDPKTRRIVRKPAATKK